MSHPDYTDPSPDMRGWSTALRRNAACCALAAAMFKARAEVYGGNPDMTTAPPHVRERFIHQADEVLTALRPASQPAHVAPFAAVRTHDGLFNFASALAREAFPGAALPHHGPVLVRGSEAAHEKGNR